MSDKEIVLFLLIFGIPTVLILLFYVSKRNKKKLQQKGLTNKGELLGCMWVVIALILGFLGLGLINVIRNIFKY